MPDESDGRRRAGVDVLASGMSAVVDASVFNPLPIGTRDLLPDAARRRRAATESLLSCFSQWGYREVMPPLIEYDEVIGRGLGELERERCVRFIEAGTGKLVALRSDVTPQIARMVAQRVGGTVGTDDAMRLCYAATLVRLPSGRHDHAELHQVGIECVGDGDPTADAELIGLADLALVGLGLVAHRFDVSHSAIVRDALRFLALAPALERELIEHLARKDRDGLARLLARAGVRGASARAFTALAELHGPPQLLDDARGPMRELGADAALERLREVVDVVAREHASTHPRVLVDLGEVRGFDYYTGMRLRVWAPGVGGPIVCGGRYDDMVGRYGVGLPATGLAIDLDALDRALHTAGVTPAGAEQTPARLVALRCEHAPPSVGAALRTAAVAETQAARARGLRAWIDREDELVSAQRLAERRGAQHLSWVYADASDGEPKVQVSRWRFEATWRKEADTSMSKQAQEQS